MPLTIHAGPQPLAQDKGAAGTWQRLLKLRTTASAMHTTAHPDDEHGGMLAQLSRGQVVPNSYAPFPAQLPARAEEVSEEDAPVEILAPAQRSFTTPNRITAEGRLGDRLPPPAALRGPRRLPPAREPTVPRTIKKAGAIPAPANFLLLPSKF